MSFFGVNVNPFSTPVGQKIEQATDGGLPSENWALNMEICDIVNETEDGPRDAIKAIKRRLNQAASKNYTVVMYTLVVLETCVKNCGKRFHSLACSRDFVNELVKTIGPKNEPPTAIQEKVLSLIRTWADTFRHQPHAQGVCQVYLELKGKGIQFPITDLDAMAPIITPERSVPESEQPMALGGLTDCEPAHSQPPQLPAQTLHGKEDSCVVDSAAYHHQQLQQPQPQPQPQQQQPQTQPQPQPLHEQLVAKLRSELDVVQGNMRVLAEMLAHLTSSEPQSSPGAAGAAATAALQRGRPEPADLELLQELYATCKAMQERVVELIGRLVDDEMTAELLRINDDLNNLFLRYSRYTKNKLGGQPPTAASAILAQAIGHPPAGNLVPEGSLHEPTKLTETDRSLIDLSADGIDPLAAQIANIGISGDGHEARATPGGALEKERDLESDEFDMFAQSRNATYETTKNSGSNYEDNMEQVSEGVGLSTAILNRGNPKSSQHHSHQSQPQPQHPIAPTSVAPSANPSRESEFNEMAAWLDRTPGDRGDSESLTSSEFERFLAERAAAAEALPTLPNVATNAATGTIGTNSNTAAASNPVPGNPNIQRQINKDQDKSLFAL